MFLWECQMTKGFYMDPTRTHKSPQGKHDNRNTSNIYIITMLVVTNSLCEFASLRFQWSFFLQNSNHQAVNKIK